MDCSEQLSRLGAGAKSESRATMGGDAAARGRKKVKKAVKFLESARVISWREQVSFLTEKGVPKEAQRIQRGVSMGVRSSQTG